MFVWKGSSAWRSFTEEGFSAAPNKPLCALSSPRDESEIKKLVGPAPDVVTPDTSQVGLSALQ